MNISTVYGMCTCVHVYVYVGIEFSPGIWYTLFVDFTVVDSRFEGRSCKIEGGHQS